VDRLEAVGDPELRETLTFVRRNAAPVTADETAAALRVHRNVARSRLERLARAGVVESSFAQRSGREGRPAKRYAAAPEASAIEFPPRRYELLLALLLAHAPARTLRARGREFGRALAREAHLRPAKRARIGLERACEAMRSLGFQASLASVSETEAVIATPTCPLRPLVREHPESAELDRGMWAGLVAASLDGVEAEDVVCETHACLEDHASCRVVLTLKRRGVKV
jgi:predicted ArsR family transcriptional regulator